MLRHHVQLVLPQLRQQVLRQDQGVHIGGVEGQSRLPAALPDEADVELRVVGRQGAVPREVQERLQRLRRLGGPLEHGVGDAGEGDDLRRQVPPRVHKGLEPVADLAVPDDHGADLRNGLPLHLEAGGLDVESHIFICKGKVLVTMDSDAVVQVVDEVALHAVEELDVPGGVPGVGKALDHAVVGDGHRRVAPGLGPLDNVPLGSRLGVQRREGVHVGEGGVEVELHPLHRGGVHPHLVGVGGDVPGVQQDVAAVPVELDVALDLQPHAGLHVLLQRRLLLLLHVLGHPHGGLEIRHVEGQAEDAGPPGLVEVGKEHPARHDYIAHLGVQPLHGLDLAPDGAAHDHLALALGLAAGGLGRRLHPLADLHLMQVVGLGQSGLHRPAALPQIPLGHQVHGHLPALPLHLHGGEVRLPQGHPLLPGQGQGGE